MAECPPLFGACIGHCAGTRPDGGSPCGRAIATGVQARPYVSKRASCLCRPRARGVIAFDESPQVDSRVRRRQHRRRAEREEPWGTGERAEPTAWKRDSFAGVDDYAVDLTESDREEILAALGRFGPPAG